jgi:predicted GNAT superfamily acetyltransferase
MMTLRPAVLRLNNDAFLLAFDETANYDSPNYAWFGGATRDSCTSIASQSHRMHVAGVWRGASTPICFKLHAALEFTKVGQASIHGGAKTVRYLCRCLDHVRGCPGLC